MMLSELLKNLIPIDISTLQVISDTLKQAVFV